MSASVAFSPRTALWRTVRWRLTATALLVVALFSGSALLARRGASGPASPSTGAASASQAAARVLAAMERLGRAGLAAPGTGTAPDDAKTVFEHLDRLIRQERGALARDIDPDQIGLTVLAADGAPIAWSGRATSRVVGPSRGTVGWRANVMPGGLVVSCRVGTTAAEASGGVSVAVEWWLPFLGDEGVDPRVVALADEHVALALPSSTDAPDDAPVRLVAPDGSELATGRVSARNAMARRRRGPLGLRSLALAVLTLGLLSLVGPLLRWDLSVPPARRVWSTVALLCTLVATWAAARAAAPAEWWPHPALTSVHYASAGLPLLRSPLDAVLATALLLGVAGCLARLAATTNIPRRPFPGALLVALLSGGVVSGLTHVSTWFARDAVVSSTLDLRQFSLLDWNPARVLLQLALLSAAAAAVVAGATLLRGRRPWRRPALLACVCWFAPGVALFALDGERAALLLAAAAVSAAGLADRTGGAAGRRRPGRRAALAMALLLAVTTGVYGALVQASAAAAHDQVGTRLAADVLNQREDVKVRVQRAMEDIDGLGDVAPLLRAPAVSGAGEADLAFGVWQATALAAPVSSSLELATADGRLLSRFAFNLPAESGSTAQVGDIRCEWMVSEEVSPFFGEDRRVWRASRAVCGADGAPVGTITIHAMVDRSDLPFLSKVRPYAELQRRRGKPFGPDVLGHDVEYAVYGWSGRPLYTSQAAAWALTPEALAAAAANRRPFWTHLSRGQDEYDVLVFSDRGAIHALGLPVTSWLGHVTAGAEAAVLAMLVAALLWGGVTAWRRRRTFTVRHLWRSASASYYRRLLVALVAAAVVPVIGLAFLFRASVAAQIRASLEQEALRTASAAERAIVDLAPAIDGQIDDDLLVWVSRLVGADVNVYEGSQLLATSGRTLFASGLLSPRTPVAAYRDVLLGLRAESVTEDRLGDVRFLTVGVPMGGARTPAIVTVPLALRQQSAEAELALFDRRVLLVALLFVVAGAVLGYSLAERMADPVRRLARATRRISRGDLEVTVLVRSADEFRNLADEFNAMAVELRRQRQQLERTHRLEAWSEVARQVAHDIKNPLTPIQLNAEHLRRVHGDQGGPMGTVVDTCVETILAQVRLLRAIASEFSNFASTPAVRLESVSVAELVETLVAPYREALAGAVAFVTRIPAGLPMVHVDRALTARALANLVENALQATQHQGTITLEARAEPGSDGREGVTLVLADSGPGMDAAALDRAFEPYFSTKAGGTGLGLPIARRNIEASGGTVRMVSAAGAGTQMLVWWPAAAEPSEG